MFEKARKLRYVTKDFTMLPSYFDDIFVHLRQKVSLRPEIFVSFRPESGPKSPARLTTLIH